MILEPWLASLLLSGIVVIVGPLVIFLVRDVGALRLALRHLRRVDDLSPLDAAAGALASWDRSGMLDLGIGDELWGTDAAPADPYRAVAVRRIVLRGSPCAAKRVLVRCVVTGVLTLATVAAMTVCLLRMA